MMQQLVLLGLSYFSALSNRLGFLLSANLDRDL